ncbi:reverse transcriptase-like protein [Priestia megaterium]
MATEFSHLFFSFYEQVDSGNHSSAKEISSKQDLLLKEMKENGYDVGALLEDLKTQKTFQQKYNTVVVFTDGGVRNNHDNNLRSLSASAFAIYGDQKMLKHDATFIGDKITLPTGETVDINSTLAEYHGLLQALLFVEKYKVKADRIIFVTDSASMVQHVSTKLPAQKIFRDYALELKNKLYSFPNVELKHVPREHNKITDALVNQLMDMYERGEEFAIN